ncbi:MAG: hypothetical protein FD180_2515 [Planctomycetota bacterium]|nr:MAG: hypothetical protein FD180_2515 [Planctomycetota bacterium]
MAKLRLYAHDSPSTAFEFAEACERIGDRDTAEQYYRVAVRLDRNYSKASDKLRWIYVNVKRPLAGEDLVKLHSLVLWLESAALHDEALALARKVLKVDPNDEFARELIEKESGPPAAAPPRAAFADWLKVRGIDEGQLTPRELKIAKLKWNRAIEYSIAESSLAWLDCAPDAPFLLCMEKSDTYVAELMLTSFREVVITFYQVFCKEYGSLFDAGAHARNEVTLVYIFATSDRYHSISQSTPWAGGHFSSRTGEIHLYKDTSQLYETLFHLCTHAAIHAISGSRITVGKKLVDSEMAWFSEGLSTYFENFKRDATGGFVFGGVSSMYKPYVKKMIADGKNSKMRDFMGVSYKQYVLERSNPSKRSYVTDTDAQSWSVVYFLLQHEGGEYRQEFFDYFKMEVEGKGSLEAAKQCFGDLDALDKEYHDYFKNMK